MNKDWKIPLTKAFLVTGLIASPVMNTIPNMSYQVAAATVEETYLDENTKMGWEMLNEWRKSLGLSVFQLNEPLLQSAKAHGEYMAYHMSTDGHAEREGNEKFTGIGPQDRAEHFGYTDAASEVLVTKSGIARTSLVELVDAPYHRMAMMNPNFKDGGIYQSFFQNGWNPLVITMGKDKLETEESKTVTYPYNGQTNVKTGWHNTEKPDPLRHEVGAPDYLGYPISVTEFGGGTLKATKAVIMDSKGQTVDFYRLDAEKEPVLNTVFLIPKQPLDLNETYHVKVDAIYAHNGEETSKSYDWSFQTAGAHQIEYADTRVGANGEKLANLHLSSGKHKDLNYSIYKNNKLYQTFNVSGTQEYKGSGLIDGSDYRAQVKFGNETWSSPMEVKGHEISFPSQIPYSTNIQDIEIEEGKTHTLDLSQHYKDDKGLTYQVLSSDQNAVGVSVSDSQLLITSKQEGESTITVVAKDSNNASVMRSFKVQVSKQDGTTEPPTNNPPIGKTISDMKGKRSENIDLNLSEYFSDPDGDELSYSVSSTNEDSVGVSVTGNTLSISPKKIGESILTVTSDDGKGGSASQTFVFTVENSIPTSSTINDHTMQVTDQPYIVDLKRYFSDDDGDKLTYEATSSNESIATVSLLDDKLTVTAKKEGTTTITVKVSDPYQGTATLDFTINVEMAPPVNHDPEVKNSLTDLSMKRKDVKTVDLNNYFFDKDGDKILYSATSSSGETANVSVNNNDLTIQAKNIGDTTITITANDGKGGKVVQSFLVSVENNAPQSKKINDLTVKETDAARTFILSDYFIDLDGDQLSYVASSSDETKASVKIENNQLVVTPKADGVAIITVKAEDGHEGMVESSFAVNIQKEDSINNEPVVKQMPNIQGKRGQVEKITLSEYFSDEDGDTLSYQTVSSNDKIAKVEITNGVLTITPKTRGNVSISVEGNDGKSGKAVGTFTYTVANEAPVSKKIDDVTLNLKDKTYLVDLSKHFTDEDQDKLTYSFTSSNEETATVMIENGLMSITPKKAGVSTMTVLAEDGHGGTANIPFTLTVKEETSDNNPPVVKPMPDAIMNLSTTKRIYLSQFFSDKDSDRLNYTVSSDNPNVVDLSVKNGILELKSMATGTATIKVKAEDGKNGLVETTFKLIVVTSTPPSSGGGNDNSLEGLPSLDQFKKEIESFGMIEPNKSFLVNIKGEVNSETVTDTTVFALDDQGMRVPLKVEILSRKKIKISHKEGTWVTGRKYTVYIDDEIKSQNGKYLKEPIKFTFNVK